MAALESTKFVSFVFPPSNPRFCNSDSLWPAKTSRSSHLVGNQRVRRPAASFSRSGHQVEVDRNAAARAEGRKRSLIASDDKSDDDNFPSLEELSRTAPCPRISGTVSKTESTVQHLEQAALNGVGLQVDQTQSGLGGRQGDSRDQPMLLDDDNSNEAESASCDVDTRCIERDASPHNTFATSELASAPIESIDASGPWYDVEEPAPGLGSSEPHGLPSAPAQAQTQTLPQFSKPLQDQTSQQGVDDITQSTPVESAFYSLPKPFDNSDDGWTDENMAELEKELGLALGEQQVESSSAGTPTSPSPRSAEALQDEIQNQERSETTGSEPEDLRDASQCSTQAQGLEWEQRETRMAVEPLGGRELGEEALVGEAEGVEIWQQGELAGQTALGDQQNQAEVDDPDNPINREVTGTLPAAQLEINNHHFRLRGIRTKQLGRRQTKTTQYRVVWGEHPNRSDSWINDDDVQISMPRLPWKGSSQDLVPQVERDVVRVHRMRCSKCSKGKKIFEYLVDELSTWVTEDQLRFSLSPMLVAKLKASSPHPLSQTQREVHLRHLATPIRDEHCHASRASGSSSAPANPALEGEPTAWKRGHQGSHTEISSVTHSSANTDNNHNACDTSDEDPRPAKRRKLRSTLARTTPSCLQSPSLASPSTASLEIDDAQPQVNHKCSSTFVDDEQRYASQASPSPQASANSTLLAEYQEWPFQGFFKSTKVGNETTYNLEFQLSHVPKHLYLPILSEALGMRSNKETSTEAAIPYDFGVHSKMHSATVRPQTKRIRWEPKEDATVVEMREDGCSWEAIQAALPRYRTQEAIQVRYSTKHKK